LRRDFFGEEAGDGRVQAQAFFDAGLEVGEGAGFGVAQDGAREAVRGGGGGELGHQGCVDGHVGGDEEEGHADSGGGGVGAGGAVGGLVC
jgi:hypothetical protein